MRTGKKGATVHQFLTHFGPAKRGGRLQIERFGLWAPGTQFRVLKVGRGRFRLVKLTGPGRGKREKGVYRVSRRLMSDGREKPVIWVVSQEFRCSHKVRIEVRGNSICVFELDETVEKLPNGKFRVKETIRRTIVLDGFEEESKALSLAQVLRRRLIASKTFTEVSLFAGIGGSQVAGRGIFQTLWALDKSEQAAEVFRLNFPRVPYLTEDIRNVLRTVPAPVQSRPDVLTMTPPCTDYSLARRAIKLREGSGIGLEGAQSGLALEALRVVKELRPRYAVVIENVQQLLTHNGGADREAIREELEELGYPYFYSVVLPALGYAPTMRHRAYAVALSVDAPFHMPGPSAKATRLGSMMFPDCDVPACYNWTKGMVRRFLERPAVNKQLGRNFHYRIADADSPYAATLTHSSHKGNESSQIYTRPSGVLRKFMEREVVRSMGFPDWFKLPEKISWTRVNELFGNSVVPPVVRAIFRELRTSLVDYLSWVTVRREGRSAIQVALAV